MIDAPVFECPQCGQRLQRNSAITCPCCGYVVTAARIKHHSNLRYWRYMIIQSRLDVAMVFLWFIAMWLAYWVMSLNPGVSVLLLCFVLAVAFTYLRRFLSQRRKRPS